MTHFVGVISFGREFSLSVGKNGDMMSYVSDHGTSELTLIEFEEEASSEPGTHNRYISVSYQTFMSRLKLVVLARHRKWCGLVGAGVL